MIELDVQQIAKVMQAEFPKEFLIASQKVYITMLEERVQLLEKELHNETGTLVKGNPP